MSQYNHGNATVPIVDLYKEHDRRCYLRDDVEKMINNNDVLLNTLGVPNFTDVKSLADEVKLSNRLVYYLSDDNSNWRYRDFEIPKRSGGSRKISAPCYSLKMLQRWVLERILYEIKVSPYSFGFVKSKESKDSKHVRWYSSLPNSSIADMARMHLKHVYILKMDLKDFYPSINRERVFSQFLKIGYGSYPGSLLTNICTHKGTLPQGAVTSPHLANIVCYHMDKRIAGYCGKRGITYTRYADDMVFSSDDRKALRSVYGMVSSISEDEGFHVNDSKTRFLSPKGRKEVLGLILNDEKKLIASRDLKRKVRTMIHHQVVSGDFSEKSKVQGYVAYIESIEPGYKEKVKQYFEKFYEDDMVTLFSEAVESFNEHKYYKDLPDMKLQSINEFKEKWGEAGSIVDMDDLDDMLGDIYADREKFLSR